MNEINDEDWSPAWSTRFTGVVDWGPPVRLNEDEMCILRENAPDATPRDIEEFEAIITSGIADRKRFDEAMLTAQARSEAQQVMSDCLKLRERLAAIAASTSRVHWDLGPTAIDELMRSLAAVMDQGALALVHYARDTGGAPRLEHRFAAGRAVHTWADRVGVSRLRGSGRPDRRMRLFEIVMHRMEPEIFDRPFGGWPRLDPWLHQDDQVDLAPPQKADKHRPAEDLLQQVLKASWGGPA